MQFATMILTVVAIGAAFSPQDSLADVEVGAPAPEFNLPGSDGNTYSLSQFKGEKPVVIAFFPKVFTGG